jgi:hypothetical protein
MKERNENQPVVEKFINDDEREKTFAGLRKAYPYLYILSNGHSIHIPCKIHGIFYDPLSNGPHKQSVASPPSKAF